MKATADGAPATTVALSIVVPVRNDAGPLARLLAELADRSPGIEVIVVDGGSRDESAALAERHGARLLRTEPGRGRQLAAGVSLGRGNWLWLLHADSSNLAAALSHLCWRATADPEALLGPGWGRFDVEFDSAGVGLAGIARMMNLRSRLTGICTGDQGIFVHRTLLQSIGGVPRQSLMEDIELSRRLKRRGAPASRPERLRTAARRWQRHGLLRTVITMWWFRARYCLGADPERLAREYYR